ncbi:MAG: pyridoxal phosphate-dependent aminotransferase [Desulfobulbaceae bacterium]|nr:pyridoxal phosphate-dependent aminotransferase [Desulfobulbaceae bacterium]
MSISLKMREYAERSSWIRRMFEAGALLKGRYGAENVFDFSLGNPDLPPPPRFGEVLREVAGQSGSGRHGYMANNGYLDVREKVAARVSNEQGMVVGGDGILMTCGAAGGLNVIMKAILDPGDEVVIIAPFFVEYHFYVDNHGGIARVASSAEDFSLDLDAIKGVLSARTKAIIINSPNNPTGQIYSAAELAALGELLADAGREYGTTIYMVADEPYRKIVYAGHEVPGVFPAYENSIVVSSWSKDLSLPGERIGYVAVHPQCEEREALLGAMTLANRILGFVNAPALMQRVVSELQDVSVDCSIYERRRDAFCGILSEAGYDFVPPKGAFYLFPKSPLADDVDFVALLQEEKILAVPGRGFGMPGYFRLAFCVEDDVITRSAPGFAKAMAAAAARG